MKYHTLSINDHEFYIMPLLTINYKDHLVITFMLQDEHRLSLGVLMYACMLFIDYCVIFHHICILSIVRIMFYIDFRAFPEYPLLFWF
jgi:hypothetical protein